MDCSLHFAFLITILLFSFGKAANSGSKLYWETKLPNTLMPQAVEDALPMEGNGDLWAATHTKTHHWTNSDEAMLLAYEGQSGHCHNDLMKESDFVKSRFFLKKDLSMESKINVHFKSGGIYTRFPSPALAQRMPPFNAISLTENLRFFSAEPGSMAAMFMNLTLDRCDHPNNMDGTNQFCATSLENLVTYVTSTLGDSVKTASASVTGASPDALVPYKVVGVTKLGAEENIVSCHRLGFPYAVYYCHQPKGTSAYSVSLVGVRDGVKTEGFAVCHDRTSEWSPEYVGFKTLGVMPGTPICHFLQFHDVVMYRA